MDPNNNQPINTNPMEQTSTVPTGVPPVSTPPPASNPSVQPANQPVVNQNAPETPKSSKKILIMLIIVVLLLLGIGSFVIFANKQLGNKQKSSTFNTNTVIPTITTAATVTPASIDEVTIESPETDLKEIEKDTQGL